MPGRSSYGHQAKLCELCGEPVPRFQTCECVPKPRPDPVASEPMLALPVTAHVEERSVAGVLLIRREGLFLFIDRCEHKPSLFVAAMHAVVDPVAGLLGGALLKATEAIGRREVGLPPGARPRDDFASVYDTALHDAPDIARCRWGLLVSRGPIRSATFRGGGLLEVASVGRDLDLWGDFGEKEAAAFMERLGYPVQRRGPAVGKKLALAAVMVLALFALGREAADLQRMGEWGMRETSAAAARAVDTGGSIQYAFVRDGKRFFVIDGREVPESELSGTAKAWYRWKEIVMVVAACLTAGAIGISLKFGKG